MARKKRKRELRKAAPKAPVPLPASAPLAVRHPDSSATGGTATTSDMSGEVYHAERGRLIEIEQDGYNQHDKAILTLTAGALAISITFLDVISSHFPILPYVVLGSWVCFLTAIVSILSSFITSQKACRQQLSLLNEEYETGVIPPQINRWAVVTGWLNLVSYAFFIIGAGLLVWFTWANLPIRDSASGADGPPVTEQAGRQ